MGRIIKFPLPEISEERCKEILSNVPLCLPEPVVMNLLQEAEYISYKFNRNNGMSAVGLQRIGFNRALEFEALYLEEAEKASEGAGDE